MLKVPRTCLEIQEKNEWDQEKRRKKGRGGMYEREKQGLRTPALSSPC